MVNARQINEHLAAGGTFKVYDQLPAGERRLLWTVSGKPPWVWIEPRYGRVHPTGMRGKDFEELQAKKDLIRKVVELEPLPEVSV